MEKQVARERLPPQAYDGSTCHGLEQDTETGLGAVDIERIEKVYRYAASTS